MVSCLVVCYVLCCGVVWCGVVWFSGVGRGLVLRVGLGLCLEWVDRWEIQCNQNERTDMNSPHCFQSVNDGTQNKREKKETPKENNMK